MAVYDARLKHVHDTDLFYWDGISITTTVSLASDIVDLGAAQAFLQQPVHIFWEVSADFSIASSLGDQCAPPAILVEDASDGSTWNVIAEIPLRTSTTGAGVAAASTISATYINARNIGLGSVRRYSRLELPRVSLTAPSATIKAWLRMGLTK